MKSWMQCSVCCENHSTNLIIGLECISFYDSNASNHLITCFAHACILSIACWMQITIKIELFDSKLGGYFWFESMTQLTQNLPTKDMLWRLSIALEIIWWNIAVFATFALYSFIILLYFFNAFDEKG